MITVDTLCRAVPGLTRDTINLFVAEGWVRAERHGPDLAFAAVDAARVRLIVELREQLAVEDSSLPIVLSLLDQLYATRRQLRRVITATPEAERARLLEVLREQP